MNKFSSALFSIFRFLLIVVICVGVSFLIVWPLWKFSTVNAKAYTVVVIILIIAAVIFLVTRKIVRKIAQKSNVKKAERISNEN